MYAKPVAILGKRSHLKTDVISKICCARFNVSVPQYMKVIHSSKLPREEFMEISESRYQSMKSAKCILIEFSKDSQLYALHRHEVIESAFSGIHSLIDIEHTRELADFNLNYKLVDVRNDLTTKDSWRVQSTIQQYLINLESGY